MRTETRALLEGLNQPCLFSQISVALEGDFMRVRTWSEAVASARTRHSEKARTAWINDLSQFLASHCDQRFQAWNNIVAEVKPEVEGAVARQLSESNHPPAEHDFILSIVNWDIVAWCLETEFSDVKEPWWYTRLGALYSKGHFPCGWDVSIPHGRLVVL